MPPAACRSVGVHSRPLALGVYLRLLQVLIVEITEIFNEGQGAKPSSPSNRYRVDICFMTTNLTPIVGTLGVESFIPDSQAKGLLSFSHI